MKRLAKLLAVALFGVVIAAVIRSVYVARAESGTGIGIINVNCTVKVAGQQCPLVNVGNDGDINVKNRKFQQLPSQLGDDRLKLVPTCVAAVNLDPGTPKLCNLFSNKRIPAFNSIFAVGVLNSSETPRPAEAVPPHLVGMQTSPGEPLFAPPSGYGIQDVNGKKYEAMVIYADSDSITLKYTDYDDFRDPGANGGGYTIHIIGINVNDALLKKYQELDNKGRKQLPGVSATQTIGSAKGNDIIVSIRDTGEFLDPRWQEDWWKGCQGSGTAATVNHQPTPYETQLKNIGTGEIRTSQSGGDSGCPSPPGGPYGGPGKEGQSLSTIGTIFPPIHSLQACPAEVPIPAEFTTNVPRAGACGITPKPEPAPCLDPKLVRPGEKGEWNESDWCGDGPNSSAWCYKDGKGTDGHDYDADGGVFDCSHGNNDKPQRNYGKNIQGYCNGERYAGHGLNNCPFLQFQNACLGLNVSIPATTPDGQPSGCSTNPKDFDPTVDDTILSYCYGYYLATHPAPKPTTKKPTEATLPACVPTNNGGTKCVTECSQPIEVNENYKLFLGPIQNCVSTQDCVLKMQLSDPQISLPFTKQLADYFAGTLDAGGVAAGSLSSDDLKKIQAAMAGGSSASNSSLVQEGFARTGVAKKLLPKEIQDTLRCQFINYVKQKVTANPKQNTKYYFIKNGQPQIFKIHDLAVTAIVPPPYIDSTTCQRKNPYVSDKGATDDWTVSASGKAWIDVPLFPDDDAQGMIQFTSPTLYSSSVKNGDAKYPNNPIGPVYVSVPDIQRLNSAVDVLQKALIPPGLIKAQQDQIIAKTYPEPIGKTLQIIKESDRIAAGIKANVCMAIPDGTSSWNQYYNPDLQKAYESARSDPQNTESEFDRGVLCKVPTKDPDGTEQSKICVVGPTGQLFCYREKQVDNPPRTGVVVQGKQVLQVRTVIPYLFDLAENAISPATGLLRIFKPEFIKQQGASLGTRDEFEKHYDPIPAASDPVKYQLTGGYATIDENSDGAKNGWKIFFYKLGGVWNARNFVLDLLNPQKNDRLKE